MNKGGRPWFKEGEVHGRAEGSAIQYMFYSKPMTNPLSILRRSALAEGSKVSTAASEVMRRLKNCSENVDKKTVEEVLQRYADNLIGMGYPEP